MRGNREPEPRVHAARIALDWRIDEIRNACELDDLVEATADVVAPHAHDRALKKDVLAAGEIRMKSSGQLDESTHPAVQPRRTAGRFQNTRQDLQRGGLPGA